MWVFLVRRPSAYLLFIVARPRQTCPITGRQAHYLDPRTGVPYADSNAYKVLTQILQHEYIWSPSLGCYVDHAEPPFEAMSDEDGRRSVQESMILDQDSWVYMWANIHTCGQAVLFYSYLKSDWNVQTLEIYFDFNKRKWKFYPLCQIKSLQWWPVIAISSVMFRLFFATQ